MFQLLSIPTGCGWLLHMLLKDKKNFILTWSPLNNYIYLISFYLIVSVLWTTNKMGWISGILQWILSLVFYFLCLHLIKTRERIDKIIRLWIWVGMIVGLIAIVQFLSTGLGVIVVQDGSLQHWGNVRSASILKEPNDLAIFLRYPIILFFAYYDFFESDFEKILGIVSMVLMLIALLLTFSRGATLSLGIGMALMIMRYAKLRKFVFWGISGILFFMLISGNGLAIYKSVSTRIMSSFDSLFSTQQVDEDLGYLVRVNNWAAAAAIIAESPVLGIGLGGYAMEAKKLMIADELLSKSGLFADKPYNLYLDILASMGLLGFLLFLLLVFVILYHCFTGSIKNKDPFIGNISFAGGTIVIIMLIKGITGEVFFESGQLWIFLAIVMSASSLPNNVEVTADDDVAPCQL